MKTTMRRWWAAALLMLLACVAALGEQCGVNVLADAVYDALAEDDD